MFIFFNYEKKKKIFLNFLHYFHTIRIWITFFVNHSYQKIAWFLGGPYYLHILKLHTDNKAYWSSDRWFWFVLYRPLIFRLFSFSLLSMNSCSSLSCLCWSTRSICNLVKFSMSTGLPERVPRWWEFWERNLARSLVASSNCQQTLSSQHYRQTNAYKQLYKRIPVIRKIYCSKTFDCVFDWAWKAASNL